MQLFSRLFLEDEGSDQCSDLRWLEVCEDILEEQFGGDQFIVHCVQLARNPSW